MNRSVHPVGVLWNRHSPPSYPRGVIPVPRLIPGTAFFPGGYGLWDTRDESNLPDLPVGGIMILGHDFHSEAGFNASIERGRESEKQPTWRNLLKVLKAAAIPLEKCFFTNFYMGLREGNAATGVFPGATDEAFQRHCSDFLIEQLSVMRPSLIVTLGKYVPALIAPLSPQLNIWVACETFSQIDAAGPVVYDCRFRGIPNFKATVAALIHPSQRQASIRYRHYKEIDGDNAEMAMLEDALRGTLLRDQEERGVRLFTVEASD